MHQLINRQPYIARPYISRNVSIGIICLICLAGCSTLGATLGLRDKELKTTRSSSTMQPTTTVGGAVRSVDNSASVATVAAAPVDEQRNTMNIVEANDSETDSAKAVETARCPTPAFPTAEGFGALSRGGRGGQVIAVTNLNNDGPGSLRAAIETAGPRTVVFRIGGTIELSERLQIKEPYLTIAGQSAPGGGITLKNRGADRDLLKISTHNVIIRYIRVRPGPGGDSGGITIDGDGTRNVILDHLSVSWSVDENVSTWYDNANITIQWSIIAEGLNHSTHSEGPHSKGLLLGAKGSKNISVHHNLLAHNVERSPRIKTSGLVDFTNNVIYNYGVSAGWITNDYGDLAVNYVGNFVKPGPDSDRDRYALEIDSVDDSANISVFVEGNLSHHRQSDTYAQNAVVKEDGYRFLTPTRHPAPPVTTTNAETAYAQVLAQAGVTIPRRDSVDERIINDVLNGTGHIIDSPEEVGGWPALEAGTPYPDADQDGMADNWEKEHSLQPDNAADNRADTDEDGYTNLEEFLNGTDPHVMENQLEGECYFLPLINHQ